MAVIDYSFTSVTSIQTTTSSSFVDIPGATISSSEFTAGKKYLIYVTANISNLTAGTALSSITTLHGSTGFADAHCHILSVSTNEWYHYGYFNVWTAVASEGINLQFLTATGTVQTDQVCLFMMNLTDALTENTDWFYAQDSTDTALSTTPATGASITFSIAGDWLVMAQSRIDRTSSATGNTEQTRISRSGEASSTTPETVITQGNINPTATMQNARVFTTTSASNTFTEESTCAGGTFHTRLDSGIFALNLDKFRNHAIIYTDGSQALATSAYSTAVQTLNITPDVAGDVWIGGYWGFDANNSSRETSTRLQVDNVDQPDTQTADAYVFDAWAGNLASVAPIDFNVVVNVTAASHTIDIDGSVDSTTGAPAAVHRQIWAVSMELPAVGAAATYPGYVGRGGWF